jgi:hypothetical protein
MFLFHYQHWTFKSQNHLSQIETCKRHRKGIETHEQTIDACWWKAGLQVITIKGFNDDKNPLNVVEWSSD